MNGPTFIGVVILTVILAAIFTHGFRGRGKRSDNGGSCSCCPYAKECHNSSNGVQ